MKANTTPLIKVIMMCLALLSIGATSAQSLQVSVTTTQSCNNSGTIDVNSVQGGTAPYTYSITYSVSGITNQITQTTPLFNGLAPGYYNVNIADVNGLTGYDSAYVGPAFYANAYITPAVCPSTTGSETVYPDSSFFSYLWSNGATTPTVTGVPVGSNYTCTITNTNTGCDAVASAYTTMYQTSSIQGSFNSTVANCTNGTSTVTPSGGTSPYTYLWSNSQTSANATGLHSQNYTVTITDAQGCSSVATTYIQQGIIIGTQPSSTAENCTHGDGTATITALNGTAPFTYQWSTGNTSSHLTNLTAGSYSVLVTDAMGCTASNYISVSRTTPITATTTAVNTSCITNNGSATMNATGGTAPYTYIWTTSPVQTTATATGLALGYYYITVTDAQGCLQNAYAYVGDSTSLNGYLSSINPICGVRTGSADALINGGNTPYQYLWNTGATTQSVTGITQSECLYLTVTDAIGCKIFRNTSVVDLSPIMLYTTGNNSSCIYTPDGNATVVASGGTAPYTYDWSNGQHTATATGLLTGHYYVYVVDANGCGQYATIYIGYNSTLPCAVQISGTVVNDYNSDCQEDGIDYGLQNVWLGCFPNGGYALTDNGGDYTFTLPPGSYSVAQTPPLYHTVICPSTPPTVTLTAGQSSPNYNFYNKPDSVNDLTIATIPWSVPVAGFTQQVSLFIGNLGSISSTPSVVYMHSVSETFIGSNPSASFYDPTTGRIEWNLGSLSANGIDRIDMQFGIPSTLATGYTLNNFDTVFPIAGDLDTFNNFESYIDYVVRAYDPNYIEVTPKGTGTPGYIYKDKDTVLQYIVHFQNTGNHYATDVKLTIPIDQNLDISTFKFIGASTSVYKISADNQRLLTIDFPQINLPDSFTNRIGSQGFAAFTFKLKAGLAPLTQIHESANIYFDYNPTVPTDTTLNTIENSTGIRVITTEGFNLYPNPTQDNVTLDLSSLNESRVEVRVYDMMGRTALESPYTSISGTKQLSLSTSGLAAGVYTVEVNGSASYVQKLVKTDK